MKQLPFTTLLLLCFTVFLHAGVREGPQFPIDGYNVFGAADSMFMSDGGFSFTGGDPDDSFHSVPSVDDSVRNRLHVAACFGSETGDPLLNKLITPELNNRDHKTFASVTYAGTKVPLTAVARYRYIDTYSDRFDSIWAQYGGITGRTMKNSNVGLVDEVFGAAAYRLRDITLSASVDQHEGWHATPYFFSPLYKEELTVSPRLNYSAGPFRITAAGSYRTSSWYFDHENPVDYNDPSLVTELRVAPGERLSGSLNLNYDKALQPAALARGGLYYNDSLIDAGIHASVFSDFKTAFDAYCALQISRQWRCSLAVARDYCRKERPYFFLEYDTVVMYEPLSIGRTTVSSTIDWKVPANVPAGISGWFFYNSRPRRESLSQRDDTLFIRQVADGGSARSFLGIKGFVDIKKQCWSVAFFPAMMTPLGRKEDVHFFVGKTASIKFTGTTAGATPASASIALDCHDRPTLNYLMTPTLGETYEKTFTAPAAASLDLSCRIPFVVPFFPKIIRAGTFSVEAGPIHLTGNLRQKAHPRGNLMGPEIHAGLEWVVR